MIRKILLVSVCTAVLGNNGANAFCTCWDSGMGPAVSPKKSSPGSHCGGGIDWDTGHLSYGTCQEICAKLWPGYNWAYVDQIAKNKCKRQNPSNVIKPTRAQKAAVEKAFTCEWHNVLAPGNILTWGIFGLIEGLSCKDILNQITKQ